MRKAGGAWMIPADFVRLGDRGGIVSYAEVRVMRNPAEVAARGVRGITALADGRGCDRSQTAAGMRADVQPALAGLPSDI
jgi:hypothetical protein